MAIAETTTTTGLNNTLYVRNMLSGKEIWLDNLWCGLIIENQIGEREKERETQFLYFSPNYRVFCCFFFYCSYSSLLVTIWFFFCCACFEMHTHGAAKSRSCEEAFLGFLFPLRSRKTQNKKIFWFVFDMLYPFVRIMLVNASFHTHFRQTTFPA